MASSASLNTFNAVNIGRVQSLIKQKFDESGIVPEEDGTLQIYKKVKLNDGLQIPANAGVDKVLVSDADGNATWQENSGGGGSSEATTINLTSDNTSGTYYLPFAKAATGNQALYTDNTGDTLTYNPSSGALTAGRFDGYLNGTINVSDQSGFSGTRWITFCDNIGSGPNTIAADSGLVYDPASNSLFVSGTVTAGSFNGNANSASYVNVTNDNTSGNYPILFSKSGGGNRAVFADTTTSPLTYNPSTGTLTCAEIIGNAATATTSSNIDLELYSSNTAHGLVVSQTSGTGVQRIGIPNFMFVQPDLKKLSIAFANGGIVETDNLKVPGFFKEHIQYLTSNVSYSNTDINAGVALFDLPKFNFEANSVYEIQLELYGHFGTESQPSTPSTGSFEMRYDVTNSPFVRMRNIGIRSLGFASPNTGITGNFNRSPESDSIYRSFTPRDQLTHMSASCEAFLSTTLAGEIMFQLRYSVDPTHPFLLYRTSCIKARKIENQGNFST